MHSGERALPTAAARRKLGRMCWSETASWAMVAVGGAMTVHTAQRGDAVAIPVTFGYFTVMEALQGAGYRVVDACGTPANAIITYLSVLHIVFQPIAINAFAMELVGRKVGLRMRALVFCLCAMASAVMLLQLQPFAWAGQCRPGTVLCGGAWCTVAGDWHIAWDVPRNGLLNGFSEAIGWDAGFPTYLLAAFGLPLLYGAWRFVVFHAMAGPMLASQLTGTPNEMPAIWCLFSVGLVLAALSPWIRARVVAPGGWGREGAA